jgi:hypothetical protein
MGPRQAARAPFGVTASPFENAPTWYGPNEKARCTAASVMKEQP